MAILHKAIDSFNAILIKLPMIFFTELEQILNFFLEPQKTHNCQSDPEEKEQSWRHNPPNFRNYYKASLNSIKWEEYTGKTLYDINCSSSYLDLSSRVLEIKMNINEWDPKKVKCFCTAKETINKMKKHFSLMEWEKIFANNVTNKALIFKIYKQLT